MSLDEWIEENNLELLRGNIKAHIEMCGDLMPGADVDLLVRCILISIRQEFEPTLKGVNCVSRL